MTAIRVQSATVHCPGAAGRARRSRSLGMASILEGV
jgi:hypothetical protein